MRAFRHMWVMLAAAALAAPATGQQRAVPRLGYAFPAGAQQGATVDVKLGGQNLGRASTVFVSGEGVTGTVVAYARPMSAGQVQSLRDRLEKAREKLGLPGRALGANAFQFARIAQEAGVTDAEIRAFREFQRARSDPKRQLNPQLQETVTLRLTVAADAEPGDRELRVLAGAGLTNPIRFRVGQLPERTETEPNEAMADACLSDGLPAVINGQVLPGDVDRFAFRARKGSRIVVAVAARDLTPYLADAVPGWFQAVAVVRDGAGKEVAYADGFRAGPDPVLSFVPPGDGAYTLEIRDAIYRGREDFVYRATVGEVPYLHAVFPLAGPVGTTVEPSGWNLDSARVETPRGAGEAGDTQVRAVRGGFLTNAVPWRIEAGSALREVEAAGGAAQALKLPAVVDGRIGRKGDIDAYTFRGRRGQDIVAEVRARRLGSPLDAYLALVDSRGRGLASNDDTPDAAAGLVTHQADPRIRVRLPADGTYKLVVRDTQGQGGPEHAYRLRVGPPQPDFSLYVSPPSVTVRASGSAPITVHVVRRDGFAGEVRLALAGPAAGFTLSGARVPPGQDRVRLTLRAPALRRAAPFALRLEGSAVLDGREVRRRALPCDEQMQAFAYTHLVPASTWMVAVRPQGLGTPELRVSTLGPVEVPAGGTARVTVPLPAWLAAADVRVALDEPPPGIDLAACTVGPQGVVVTVRAAGTAKAGAEGNLVFEATRAAPAPAAGAAAPARPNARRRVALGTLPAVPYRIVAR